MLIGKKNVKQTIEMHRDVFFESFHYLGKKQGNLMRTSEEFNEIRDPKINLIKVC